MLICNNIFLFLFLVILYFSLHKIWMFIEIIWVVNPSINITEIQAILIYLYRLICLQN